MNLFPFHSFFESSSSSQSKQQPPRQILQNQHFGLGLTQAELCRLVCLTSLIGGGGWGRRRSRARLPRKGIGSFSAFSRSFCISVGQVERNMSLRCCQNDPCLCGPFPRFVALDFQRGGLIPYRIKFLKPVCRISKNAIITGGAKELKCNTHSRQNDESSSGIRFQFSK